MGPRVSTRHRHANRLMPEQYERGERAMAIEPTDRLSILLEKIAKQRIIVATLKSEGHVHTDAERQLTEMTAQLARYIVTPPPASVRE
jgi:hypothetical protein